MRVCRPHFCKGNLAQLRRCALIYDEVMTGFGAYGRFVARLVVQYRPIILCLSKLTIGRVLALSAYAGYRRHLPRILPDDIKSDFLFTVIQIREILSLAPLAWLELF